MEAFYSTLCKIFSLEGKSLFPNVTPLWLKVGLPAATSPPPPMRE
jgi:hypothetical protein